ncbi:FecCD family ABC transporter permease [Gephyromycinifex aptenodytis]|uniref:FecCD family ABC transporter permease n=1 Tax=Gephyromycinifex aptenodytis TaxID=2716227 RepID=UPI001D0183AE|nr:iron chelate uptake ABC transporter family permease subunit [Gephyromycinifex aptenodytis]
MKAAARECEAIDFGYPHATVRMRRAVALRFGLRTVAVNTVLGALMVLVSLLCLRFGDYPLETADIFGALSGHGDPFARMIVLQWRVPVVLAAVAFGALLGVSGAIFQSITRNPLGSPDVIGFDAGAYTAVVITILVVGTSHYWAVAGAAVVGGLLTALVVYLLAYQRGVQGFRLIIVGIAVSAMLGSINAYLITRADINDAMSVGFWGAGSLSRVTWASIAPTVGCGALILLWAGSLTPALRQLELGDDTALAHGVDSARARPALLVAGVAASALVTAAAGPIGFVALSAPQLARRLTGTPGVTLTSSAFMGGALLTLAQGISLAFAQWYRTVPVGVITVCLGGLYLIWLLIRETRRHP